jgi:hypothetical protein
MNSEGQDQDKAVEMVYLGFIWVIDVAFTMQRNKNTLRKICSHLNNYGQG